MLAFNSFAHRSVAVALACLVLAAAGRSGGRRTGPPGGGMPPMGVEVVTLAEEPVEQAASSSAR